MNQLTVSLTLFIFLLLPSAISHAEPIHATLKSRSAGQTDIRSSFKQDAQLIRATYEAKLFMLPAFKSGHYGLRMYRQTQDNKYKAALWSDMARVASRLNKFAREVYTPEQIQAYSSKRIEDYRNESSERSQLRYEVSKKMPEYLYLGIDLLGSMARANEYGLKHREDAKLHQVIGRYDFLKYATNEKMIKAWAAQLANQVYWLRQLGEQDVVDEFIRTFRKTYPDSNDSKLSEQQFANKIYGLTHIIFASSAYYQYPIREADFQWVYDYYRDNIDTIIARAKADVIAEVGINFLLAGLADDAVVHKTQRAIQQALNREYGLVPSVTGGVDLIDGEHRNVLAIMLLDWKGAHAVPKITTQPDIFDSLPYGLVAK